MSIVSRETIAVRAYEIWEQEGRPHGRDMAHWIKAAEELAPAPSQPEASAAPGAKPKRKTAKAAAAAAPVAAAKAPLKGKRTPTRAK